jgi:transcription elongation GreA/GreB family factor
LRIACQGKEIVVITGRSPMGRELLGKSVGDSVEIEARASRMEYEIVEVS